jgi:NADPH:quinone reductase-like Zn-dependent oxidoreductase
MWAVTIVDGELLWEGHPDPRPGDSELLLRVHAAGINAADLIQLKGGYPAPPGSPQDIPGLELAGEVISVGPRVNRFAPGDRVMALVGGGGQAELATVDQGSAIPIPTGVSWEAAGGFPEAFTTAYDALFTQAGLGFNERVLITGAAGGVGTAAVQLAAAAGALVVASVRNESLREEVLQLGADQALDPAAALEQGPFDLALELVGGQSVGAVLERLAQGGRISVIGLAAGRTAELNLSSLMGRRARIFGSTLRSRSQAEKSLVAAAVIQHVVPLLERGKIRVPVASTFPMEQAAEAYRRQAAGGKLGKIVLLGGIKGS